MASALRNLGVAGNGVNQNSHDGGKNTPSTRIMRKGPRAQSPTALRSRAGRAKAAFADVRVQSVFSHHLQIPWLVPGLNKVTAFTTVPHGGDSCSGRLCVLPALLIFSRGKNTRNINFLVTHFLTYSSIVLRLVIMPPISRTLVHLAKLKFGPHSIKNVPLNPRTAPPPHDPDASGSSCRWSHTPVVLCDLCLTEHHVPRAHPRCSLWQGVLPF